MGIHDRDYYREDEPGWSPGKPQSVVVWIIVINAVLYLANMFSQDDALTTSLSLKADLFQQPLQFWQLLTYGFVHSPDSIFHILMNMWMLFVLGRMVEDKYGGKEFLTFYLLTIVLAGLGWVSIHAATGEITTPDGRMYSSLGASGGVVAVVILFCLNFPKQRLLLFGVMPIAAWVLGVMVVGFDLLRAIRVTEDNVAWEAHIAGALLALIYFKLGIRLSNLLPKGKPALKRRPKLRVHDPNGDRPDLEAKGDAILDKIHREGEDSLTAKERRTLEEYSRHMREKRT